VKKSAFRPVVKPLALAVALLGAAPAFAMGSSTSAEPP
jgi:hypothetical protein